MSREYLDQNALIELGLKARTPKFREKLDSALENGSLSVVVSPWHLIETAHQKNLDIAIELAEFIDSLNPGWLMERHDILKLEVQEDFYRFLKLDCTSEPRVTTRSAVFAALTRRRDAPRLDIPSSQFVRQWIEHPEQVRPLQKTYEDYVNSLIRLRELVKDGKVTDEIRKRVNEILLNVSLPKTTPAGLELGREVKTDYVAQAKAATIPSLAIETAISEHEWAAQGGADRNTLIDKFHLIAALPYVDEIVSNDKLFRKLRAAAVRTGYVKAQLIGNDDFLRRF